MSYKRIASASRKLAKETKITFRRQAADDLVKLLTDTSLRSKLKKEIAQAKIASSKSKKIDVEKEVRKELEKLYRGIFRDALEATLQTLKSKVKFKVEDVNLLLKVVRAIDAESDNAISSVKEARNQNWSYVTEPFTFESYDRYRGSNMNNSYLSGTEIKSALKSCLGWLESEQICIVAESDLMNLLLKLCSRSDYVSAFGTSNERVSQIIEELHFRIVPHDDDASSSSSSLQMSQMVKNAAKTFYNLFHNLVSVLGIEISLFVLPALKLIVEWVRHEKSDPTILQFMYGVAVELLAAYPHLCVGIFESDDDKNLGKDLFGYAVRTWGSARNVDRDVLVGFFSAYLLVCETAGHIQGLFPGDLGEMGSASLNQSKILQLSEMFLSDKNLEVYSSLSIQAKDSGNKSRDRSRERSRNGNVSKKRRFVDSSSIFNPLSKRERRYLEFCARILRCAQRYSLMEAERAATSNLLQTIVDDCVTVTPDDESDSKNGLSSARCIAPIEKLQTCPWITFVVKGLCSQVTLSHTAIKSKLSLGDIPKMKSNSKQFFSTSQSNKAANKSEYRLEISQLPMKAALQDCLKKDMYNQSVSQDQVKIYLQIVTACAEIFPRGECWSSTNQWFESSYSPMEGDIYSIEQNQRSYCNTCSPSDMASLVDSVCDILCHYGTTGGNLNIQMWALVCLLKLTESSKIAARYWDETYHRNERDLLSFAWQRIWDTLFRQDLRFLTYTGNVVNGSHGELVLMLLTEIIKWSLTTLKDEFEYNRQNNSFIQKRQEKVWRMPLFKSAKRIHCSAAFEFITILLHNVELFEGGDDVFNESEFDTVLKYIPMEKTYEGGKRRYRIVLFCLTFILSAIKRDDVDLLKRVLPFVTESVAAVTGNGKATHCISSFSICTNRHFQVTESKKYVNENEKIHNKDSNFTAAWKDSIEPFWFQFSAENNHFLWDAMNGREISLCPAWSMEDRNWLNRTFFDQYQCSGPTISAEAVELYNITIGSVLSALGFGHQANHETAEKSTKMSLLGQLYAVKFIIVISLHNEYNINDCGIQWRFVEELFDSILGCVVNNTGEYPQEALPNILTEMVGIFHLLRKSYLAGKCHHQVRGLLSCSNMSGLYNMCKEQLEIVEKDMNCKPNGNNVEKGRRTNVCSEESGIDSDDELKEDSQPGQFDDIYPNSSKSEPDSDYNYESDDDSIHARSGMKRKLVNDPQPHKNAKKSRDDLKTNGSNSDERITQEIEFGSGGTKESWLCAYILLALNPSFEVINIIDRSNILPEDSIEPHNYVVCLGLFYHFVPLSLTDPEEKGDYTVFSMCRDLINEGRTVASQSSPFCSLGFQACKMLTVARIKEEEHLNSQEMNDIMNALMPENDSTTILRALKTRPFLKYLQLNAAISCFREGGEAFRKLFESSFSKTLIAECLRSKVSNLRRAGAFAASLLLNHFEVSKRNSTMNEIFRPFPPFDVNPYKKRGKTFDDWVDKRVSICNNKNNIDSERLFWKASFSSLYADVCYTAGIFMGYNEDEDMVVDLLGTLFQSDDKGNLLKLRLFESIAFIRKYESLEDHLQQYKFDLIRNWIAEDKTLLSIPTILCPSPTRCMIRIGCFNDVSQELLQNFVADEFVNQNTSIIIPCILIDQPRLGHDEEVIKKRRDRLLAEVVEVCEDDKLSKLLRSHIHDVLAVTIPMIHCNIEDNSPFKKRGDEIIAYLLSFPDLSHKHVSRSTNQIVVQILQLYVKDFPYEENVTNCKSSIQASIKYFATNVMNIKTKLDRGLFENAGTSTTECLLHARRLLDESTYTTMKKQAWKMIDFILQEVEHNICDDQVQDPQLGFAISTLLNLLTDKRQGDLRYPILLRLNSLIQAVTKDPDVVQKLSNDLISILNKLVLTMIQIHEDCQQCIMKFCLNTYHSEFSKRLKTLSFNQMSGDFSLDDSFNNCEEALSSDPVDLAISKYADKIPLHLIHQIETAHDVLNLILIENKDNLEEFYVTLDPFPSSTITEDVQQNLIRCNSRFGISRNILTALDHSPQTSPLNRIHGDAKRFERVAKRFIGNLSERKSDNQTMDSHGLEARTLLAGIDRVKRSIAFCKSDKNTSSFTGTIVRTLSAIVKYLCDFCGDQYCTDIQVAASSCLGSLLPMLHEVNADLLEIYNMQSEKRTFFQSKDDLYDYFFEDIMKLLVDYIRSTDTETAIIAKDTLKAILKTDDGSSFWKDLEPGCSIRRFVGPLESKEKVKLDVNKIPNKFLKHLQGVLESDDDLENDFSWCWSAEIWRCEIDCCIEFKDWIRNVVSSILMCCYGKDKHSDSNEAKTLIHGSSDFFRPCLKLCTREHKFAEALFPALIFDILATDVKDSSANFSTNKTYLVGAATSLSNQTITQCFEVVLKPSDSEDNARNFSQDSFYSKSHESVSNLDAVKAIVNVLNILRCCTEHNFYYQKHKLNKMQLTGRNYDAKKGVVRIEDPKQTYNDLNSSVHFIGRPYGVVLDFHDTEIAYSYLKLKDYATAMYYAENYADNRLGGSACSFEMYPFREIKQTSLSGFGKELETVDSKETDLIAIDYHDILKQCFTALHEEDNLKGLEEQTSMLRFEKPECFKDDGHSFISTISKNRRSLNEKSLMVADAQSQIDSGRGIPNPRNQASVLSNLSNLSLRDTARHYIAGICLHQELSAFSSVECSYVKEKWAEETWRMLQWDDTLFPKNPSASIFEPVNQPLPHDKDLVNKALRESGIQDVKVGFNEALSNLFQSIMREDLSHFSSDLYQSRAILLKDYNRDVGTKPSNGLFSHSLKFMAMSEMEDLGSVISGSMTTDEFLNKWCSESSVFGGKSVIRYSFDDVEYAMACREISLKLIFRKFGTHANDPIGSTYLQHLKRTCVLAREHERPNLARGALERMRRFLDLTCNVDENKLSNKIRLLSMNLEEARILQSGGDTTAAVRTCKLIISSLGQLRLEKSEELCFLNGETLLQCGMWLIKHKIDAASIVLNKYVRRAAEQAQEIHKYHYSWRSTKLLSSTHFVLAEFVANLYDSVEKRVNSQEWKSLGIAAEGRKKELEEVTAMIKNCKKSPHKAKKTHEFNLKIEQSKLKKEVEMDTRERSAVEESVSSYLRLAIRAYGVALSHCTGLSLHSKHVFRLVSLWFRNSSGEGKGGDINALIASDVTCRIPSYHFVPLIYQIFSRIDSSLDMDQDNYTSTEAYHEEFQNVLVKLIARICMDHPYHGLVQLIALSNGHNVAGRQASAYLYNVGDSKVEASSKLLASMERDDPDFLAQLIQSYKTVIDAYISLAIAPTKQFADKRITKNIAIRDLVRGNKNRNQCQPLDSCLRRSSQYKPCVLTKTPSIRSGADYGDGLACPVGSEFIDSFQSTCSITETGIHRPKIVVCIGSNGGKFKQLVKGEDDIRQDAIMQQVFQTVNVLFQNQSATKKQSSSMKSNIKLHTYSCIPLSPSNGVLEWVDNTTSFGDFLYRSSNGKKMGAHERYYPGEWDISLCRSHYMCSPRDEVRASYDEICKNFSPCFRFFFLERFSHSPQRWHDARMAYVRSSAVNSIVGHILGIGDRHSHNILIHEKTGEVVHIDFGIVFEQGKLLSTPETVPFRLTRDVVDGFGPNGTDGAFTVAAQATAEVLRENATTLITVLSAVVSDPLYSWSVSPVKARQREDESIFSKDGSDLSGNTSMPALAMIAENENDAATLTIAKINEKLQGYEEGTYGEQQTVEGQVRLLINAARDPDNLCTLYHGWMPWL